MFNGDIQWSEIQIQKKIGEGHFANVYLGKWLDAEVAIKQWRMPNPPELLSVEAEQNFLHESQRHVQCNSPRIVRLFGITNEPGHFALIMEYLPKGSLRKLLNETKPLDLPWRKRWEIAVDIATGLGYLHGKGISHRDLRSKNILLDRELRAQITGLAATQTSDSTSSLTPETIRENYKNESLADVYSYGTVLWELASHAVSFAGESRHNLLIAIRDGRREDISDRWPRSYADQINACWGDVAVRPNVRAVQTALQASCPARPRYLAAHHDVVIREQGGYALLAATDEDRRTVEQHYARCPVPDHDIQSVEVIYNPSLDKMFAGKLETLEALSRNDVFKPKWAADEQRETRQTIDDWHRNASAPYQDAALPNVRILPMWHGTNERALPGIFSSGYASLTSTDAGFFGQGLYSSYEAEYAYRVYATQNYARSGALLMNWVANYSAYPVISGDEGKLQRGPYSKYDGHLVPVKPAHVDWLDEINYYPCNPRERSTYTEMVVFEAAQCLPRYLVHLALRQLPGETEYKEGIEHFIHGKYRDSKQFFEQAAAQNYPPAYLALWNLYSGLIKPINSEQARYWKQRTADHIAWFQHHASKVGRIEAQNTLGVCYLCGIGVAQDYGEAAKWYERAALRGYALAQRNLAFCYYNGHGVAKNYGLAVKWYDEAAQQGEAEAQYNLANCCYNGQGVPTKPDYPGAVWWYRKAADQGHSGAKNMLGHCYYHGHGLARDYQIAVKWYDEAAQQQDVEAQYNLANCCYKGYGLNQMQTTNPDYPGAVWWYQKAANQGHKEAQYMLAHCYYKNEGVSQERLTTQQRYVKAVQCYHQAADQGHKEAQYMLGHCYYNNEGVSHESLTTQQRYAKAVQYYRQAADQGHKEAQYMLGKCYYHGNGVDQHSGQATIWYRRAADQGHAKAQNSLGDCYYHGHGVRWSYEAVKWYSKAASQGDANGQYNLGWCYYKGWGLTENRGKAKEWFSKAAAQGHQKAKSYL